MISHQQVEEMLVQAFGEALKERFRIIAANELTQGRDYEKGAIRAAMSNLKMELEDGIAAIPEIFS